MQFVRFAIQNSMACQIDGCTLHHWSGIPVGETGGTALTKDAHKLATKRQSSRWVLIDEVSMISAQLVGVLDMLIGKVPGSVTARNGEQTVLSDHSVDWTSCSSGISRS